ncbi:MAG: hypothetical protein JWR25_1031, partial [Noviherbaspirillum sp.]|nr:hypothetical protein [Noviherbaspirillum sp.]
MPSKALTALDTYQALRSHHAQAQEWQLRELF